jgi:chromosome segregation ATPase
VVGADPRTNIVCEIARLQLSIDRAAAATETTLERHRPARADDSPRSPLAEHEELRRQLAALRERVALAENRNEGAPTLRAELATLLFFASTLQADANNWRAAVEDQTEELERQRAAARREQETLAAERENLMRRRDALQSTILQTAARMAQQNSGECRRTLPVITLGEGLTVCSVSVSRPGRWFRFAEYWLVTLNRSQDVLVRRD